MPSILIVDDNRELASVMGEYLSAKDHNVDVVYCGKDARKILRQRDFDLLILDWELPDANGPDICRDYRDLGGTAAVLMLTGRKSTEDKVTGLQSGADDYLTKPFNIPEFNARIEALLRRASMSRKSAKRVYDESILGQTFAGSYTLESVLGFGGMGIVYKAKHNTIARTAAIKVLSGQFQGSDARKRFEREAKAMSLLDHPNLIKIFDFGIVDDNVPYIIMEYVEGTPLNRVIKECGPMPYIDCLPLIIQICDALQHAHSQAIIHRDLKPSNIILSPDGRSVKVLDLGLARMLEQESGVSEITLAGEVFGSPYYMSPEQCKNSAVDQRSDIYSLGCVLYELLSGARPFEGDSFLDLANAKIYTQAPSLCQSAEKSEIPQALGACVARSLECLPENRQASMAEFKEQLQKICSESSQLNAGKIVGYLKKLLKK